MCTDFKSETVLPWIARWGIFFSRGILFLYPILDITHYKRERTGKGRNNVPKM